MLIFFCHYKDDEILKLADLKTLLITKLKATCDRAEYKDYIDIITILKTKKISLQEALQEIPNYFGSNYPLINIAKGLTYFEDGDLYRLSDEEKKFLCRQVNELNFERMQDCLNKNFYIKNIFQ